MEWLKHILGLGVEPKDLTVLHVAARGIIIFLYCIFLVRIADKRFLSQKSALDAVLGFILASMIARAINGSAPFFPTMAGSLLIVMLHRSLAHLAVKWHRFGNLVKGTSEIVIQDGQLNEKNLRANNFSHADMLEDLRLKGVETVNSVHLAHVERNGEISVVRKED